MQAESVTLSVDNLQPHPNNPRLHSEDQLQALAQSIKLYGQFRQIVVDEKNTILAGHGIVEAMKRAGETSARCYRITGLSVKAKKKLLLVDNHTQSMGLDDLDTTTALIKEIGSLDIPGYSEDLLQAIIDSRQEAVDQAIKDSEERMYGRTQSGEDFFEGTGAKANAVQADIIRIGHGKGARRAVICPTCKTELWLDG